MIMAFRCEIWFTTHGFDKKRLGILGSNLGALHVPFFFFFRIVFEGLLGIWIVMEWSIPIHPLLGLVGWYTLKILDWKILSIQNSVWKWQQWGSFHQAMYNVTIFYSPICQQLGCIVCWSSSFVSTLDPWYETLLFLYQSCHFCFFFFFLSWNMVGNSWSC